LKPTKITIKAISAREATSNRAILMAYVHVKTAFSLEEPTVRRPPQYAGEEGRSGATFEVSGKVNS
jgi:hypothetical protein